MKLIIVFVYLVSYASAGARLSENDRIEQWRQKHVWPPQWQEETEGYKALQRSREAEIMQIPGSNERWENWM